MSSRQHTIETLIKTAFEPTFYEVINESHRHRSHLGDESHFKVILVSSQFEGLKQIERHRAVQNVLSQVQREIHALSLQTYTPSEWESKQKTAHPSPPCRSSKSLPE